MCVIIFYYHLQNTHLNKNNISNERDKTFEQELNLNSNVKNMKS